MQVTHINPLNPPIVISSLKIIFADSVSEEFHIKYWTNSYSSEDARIPSEYGPEIYQDVSRLHSTRDNESNLYILGSMKN